MPSETGSVSSKTLSLVKLRMEKLSSHLSGQGSFLPAVVEFLGLEMRAGPVVPVDALAGLVGSYVRRDGDGEVRAEVTLRGGALSLAGVPELWPQNRLVPVGVGEFRREPLVRLPRRSSLRRR